jgi:hypothetical protein
MTDFSKYNIVFCDSLKALEWAYKNGLPESAVIKTSSPALLWSKNNNICNIEKKWSTEELGKFQKTIKKLSKDVFDIALNIGGIERELALAISNSVFNFQKTLYKVSCLNDDDFSDSRLFIYVDGKTGLAGNIMNSPWDQILSKNPLFSMVNYTLHDDEWKVLTTKGVSYWRRLKVAGYETIIYRLALKLMKAIPDWVFTKEVLMPNENELNIEIASSLALHGVKISKIKLNNLYDNKNITLDLNTNAIYEAILPIVRKRIELWAPEKSVEITIALFKSQLVKQLKEFKYLVGEWEKVLTKNKKTKKALLINAPGNIKGQSLSYVCRKNNIPFISSQHGVTIEISKVHNIIQHVFDNSISDAVFSYNSKIIDIEKKTFFNKSEHYSVGMPFRLIRMKNVKTIVKPLHPIVYISTNLYHRGFNLSKKTDYMNAIDEYELVIKVLSKLPHRVCYKTYPEDNRRYADIDPVINTVNKASNIDIFSDKIDMRFLISKHRILVTAHATSTLGWPVMSGRPVIFINQKNNYPLLDDAHTCMSEALFVFDDDDPNFYKDLRDFLSQSLEEIERLWQEKKNSRDKMINDYFSAYKGGAGKRAAQIMLKEYLN